MFGCISRACPHAHTCEHTDNTVGIAVEPGPDVECPLEISTEERNSVVIPLRRYGSLDHQEGVVCYTQDHSAKAKQDYVSRPRTGPGSEVTFAVNASRAECVVEIREDDLLEPRERFMVRLAATAQQGFINIDPRADSICVYINYDYNDGERLHVGWGTATAQRVGTVRRVGMVSYCREGGGAQISLILLSLHVQLIKLRIALT